MEGFPPLPTLPPTPCSLLEVPGGVKDDTGVLDGVLFVFSLDCSEKSSVEVVSSLCPGASHQFLPRLSQHCLAQLFSCSVVSDSLQHHAV